jgi:hypothetical protein
MVGDGTLYLPNVEPLEWIELLHFVVEFYSMDFMPNSFRMIFVFSISSGTTIIVSACYPWYGQEYYWYHHEHFQVTNQLSREN